MTTKSISTKQYTEWLCASCIPQKWLTAFAIIYKANTCVTLKLQTDGFGDGGGDVAFQIPHHYIRTLVMWIQNRKSKL